jgi:hypothetical protein
MPRSRSALTPDQVKVVDTLRKLGGISVYWELEARCRKLLGPKSLVSIRTAVTKGAIKYVDRTPEAPAKYKLVSRG